MSATQRTTRQDHRLAHAADEPGLFDAGRFRGQMVNSRTSVVTVTDVHLKEGAPGSENWCAVAVALREELHADTVFDDIEVTAAWVRVSTRRGSWYAAVTPGLYALIREFDATAGNDGEPDPGKLQAIAAKASAGLLRFPLTWHEGDPPENDRDD